MPSYFSSAAAIVSALLFSFLLIIDPPLAESSEQITKWEQWTCDELTPNLCELQVEAGYVTINSIPVHYWRYTKSKSDDKYYGSSSKSFDGNSTIAHSIIAIHGGPAWPHSYLLPLKQLACRGDTAEVIFYDQGGCGLSIPPHARNDTKLSIIDDFPHLLDPKYYSEVELPALIQHWELESYHILGHSWGSILAQLFVLNYVNKHFNLRQQQVSEGLQSLILSGPISDAKAYINAQWDPNDTDNLASLPPFVQQRIHALEEAQEYDSEEYQAIDSVLTTFFTLRTAPSPDCLDASANGINEDIYVGMQGASEFTISGVLGTLNLTQRLSEIKIPVLLTHGKFDTMRPSTVIAMQGQIKRSERVMLPHSGHVSMIDDAELMNDVVANFVHRVESGDEIGGNEGEGIEATPAPAAKAKVNGNIPWNWIQIIVAFLAGIIVENANNNKRKSQYRRV